MVLLLSEARSLGCPARKRCFAPLEHDIDCPLEHDMDCSREHDIDCPDERSKSGPTLKKPCTRGVSA